MWIVRYWTWFFNDFWRCNQRKYIRYKLFIRISLKITFLYLTLFLWKKTTICCFLHGVFTFTLRRRNNEFRTFHIKEIIDQLINRKLDEIKKEFYEDRHPLLFWEKYFLIFISIFKLINHSTLVIFILFFFYSY